MSLRQIIVNCMLLYWVLFPVDAVFALNLSFNNIASFYDSVPLAMVDRDLNNHDMIYNQYLNIKYAAVHAAASIPNYAVNINGPRLSDRLTGRLPGYHHPLSVNKNSQLFLSHHKQFYDDGHFINDIKKYVIDCLISLKDQRIQYLNTKLLCSNEWIFNFYEHQDYKPVWITTRGVSRKALDLVNLISKAEHEGLRADDYHYRDLTRLIDKIRIDKIRHIIGLGLGLDPKDLKSLAEFDILLTDAFFSFGFHLSEGIIDPYTMDFDWHIKKQERNLGIIFKTFLNNADINGFISTLQPQHSGYAKLKNKLIRYCEIKESGELFNLSLACKLQKGDQGTKISSLRSRLIMSGDLPNFDYDSPDYFDTDLENGVKRFQARQGLEVDGVVGEKTLEALNTPIENRIQQIKLNMERWRWLPRDLGKSHIMVNTANFELQVVEHEQKIKSIRAIVGKKHRPTPVLSKKITSLELNPYWNIPHNIAVYDMLPRIRKDPEYLTNQRIKVFESWKYGAKEVNPESIDWKNVTRYNFAFKLRQDPSDSNALGRMKFVFPNDFAVYLHDTPTHRLFSKNKRTFSSGCVRIEKPMELAAYLLKDDPNWNLENLNFAIESKKTKKVTISNPKNIHILYWTAWVDESGSIQFRDDVYGRDNQLVVALHQENAIQKELFAKYVNANIFAFRHNSTDMRHVNNCIPNKPWLFAKFNHFDE